MSYTIALDAMGGDHGASVVTAAAKQVLEDNNNVRLILVGDQEVLNKELSNLNLSTDKNLSVKHASQKVEMDESPALALRNKKDSSMRVAINLVKDGVADACVSAGNTGALMATSRFVLKTLPGIDRPAICCALPTMTGHTHMLDLGANVDTDAEHLFQFAVMASTLVEAVDNNSSPTIGLLNVGEEDIKGDETVKAANKLLVESGLNYVGFVEGDDIYKGTVDVVVCDGFVGNVSLKTTEGVAKMISQFMKEEFMRNPFTKLAGLLASPVLKAFKRRIDPRAYNGATLLGLRGVVIKSHGGADAFSFANAIKVAVVEVDKKVPQTIPNQLEYLLKEKRAV